MARKPKIAPKKGEPTQTTDKGLEIPIPKRSAFYGNLKKTVRAPAPQPNQPKPPKPSEPFKPKLPRTDPVIRNDPLTGGKKKSR